MTRKRDDLLWCCAVFLEPAFGGQDDGRVEAGQARTAGVPMAAGDKCAA